MFIKSIMIPKQKCITVQKSDPMKVVLHKLESNGIDGMPVLDGDEYIGIITRYWVYKTYFEDQTSKEEFLEEKTAAEAVTRKDEYITEDEVFEQTLLRVKDTPLVAVVKEDRRFLGVVVRPDVLEQFQSAFGMKREGVRISFTSVETEGRIARLADIAKQYHENIISLATFDETDKLVRRIVMKIEKKKNVDRFIKKLEQSGFKVLDIKED